MEISPWQVWAKVVAIVDIVILCIDILGVLLILFLLANYSNNPSNQDIMEEFDLVEDVELKRAVPIWFLGIFFVVAAFVIGIQMWAAVLLLLAAELGKDPHESLKNARTWKWIAIVFLVISVIGCIGSMAIITLVITLVMRGVGLYVVHNFMKDTELYISSQARGNDNFPVGISVNK